MDFTDLIVQRYSVRAYKPDSVEKEHLDQVLQAARLAPTAADKQPFRLIVVHTPGKEDALKRIYDREWFTHAPVVICACGVPEEAWVHRNGKNHCEIDVTIAMDYVTLAAANVGLGTCWIAAFDVEEARKFLKLPEGVEPVFFTPLGYPADTPGPKERRSLAELVRYEQW